MQDYASVFKFIHQNQNQDIRDHYATEQDIHDKLMVPLQLQQLIVGQDEQGLAGIATFAFMSDADQQRYVNDPHQDMTPQMWQSGQNCWVVLLIARPDAGQDFMQQMIKQIGPGLNRKVNFMRGDRVMQMDFTQGQQAQFQGDPSQGGAPGGMPAMDPSQGAPGMGAPAPQAAAAAPASAFDMAQGASQ